MSVVLKRLLWLVGALALFVLLESCESKQPYVGVIVVDTDLPTIYKGELPIGVTLDPGSGGRDLLGTNLLINGGFDLATLPANVGYDVEEQAIVTPNGSRLFYPTPHQHYGWTFLGGNISVLGGGDNYYLSIIASSNDSIVAFTQIIQGGSMDKGQSFDFSCRGQAVGNATLYASIVDDSLRLVSNRIALSPRADWARYKGVLTTSERVERTQLLLEVEVTEGETYLVQNDSVSYWTNSRRASLLLDDLRLDRSDNILRGGISADLYSLLKDLDPAFVRYPCGTTANGIFPGTYPLYLDSLKQKPLWTLRENELTDAFGYPELLRLTKELGSTPVLVANSGFTDPSTIQRVEDIKELPSRIAYMEKLIDLAGASEVTIQPGYNLTSMEYDRRFTMLLEVLEAKYPELQIISAGNRSAYQRYSDYPYDLILPEVSYDNLEQVDSLIAGNDLLLFPHLISEVTFDKHYDTGYFLPPLALRAAFLILSERRTPHIRTLGITPLLSTNIEQDFPIVEVVGGAYQPTQLYDYLRDFMAFRGAHLHRLDNPNPLTSDVILSITSDEETGCYYLKAVNMTRHPLNYRIKLKGQNSGFSKVKIISYTSTQSSTSSNLEGFTHYERKVSEERMSFKSSLSYLFAPFEVVLFRFE
ncbi:MAG: hypothetical protein PUK66_00205 [Bacteroidales bacterium]|uniref:hypothetical protein n=1 Tax=Porphyromonas sp. TaxID=1924944 RepID=UPI0029782CE5|nr:hypothetical protein [Porphyromonas sp.]MDD7437258.1 hypothetical protein [Bacteroidales bacterium]MDY3068021.1 hypothetical protein [Porphyromonas sp.]